MIISLAKVLIAASVAAILLAVARHGTLSAHGPGSHADRLHHPWN